MTTAVLARDTSNFTVQETEALLEQWKAAGTGLVIIQLFPSTYVQYANQVQQMRLAKSVGIPFDGYIYDYLASPDWRNGCVAGLQPLVAEGLICRRLWADEEDVTASAAAMSVNARIAAVGRSLTVLDLAPTRLNPTGIYTSRGYWLGSWGPKGGLGNYSGFSDRPLWDANYDNIANTTVDFHPYGGWTHPTIKQYAGSQPDGTDLDVLSAEEVGQLTPPEVTTVAIVVGQGLKDAMAVAGDAPLFGHKFYTEVDDQGRTYQVEECYGAKGRYAASNSNGPDQWVTGGPF